MKEKYYAPFFKVISLKMEGLMNPASPETPVPEYNPPFGDETDWGN